MSANSYLGRAIENKLVNVPEPNCIHNNPNMTMPYVFLADDAFGLKPNLIKPFPDQYLPLDERIFNYRLSRARSAATRFRVFRRPIIAAEKR